MLDKSSAFRNVTATIHDRDASTVAAPSQIWGTTSGAGPSARYQVQEWCPSHFRSGVAGSVRRQPVDRGGLRGPDRASARRRTRGRHRPGSPLAMRVTVRPNGFSSRARYIAVTSPSVLGLVHRMTSCTPSGSMPGEQLAHLQLLGADPLERAHRAEQHVIAAAELAGLLDRHDVARLLDDAHHRRVATVVEADRAQLALGDVEAPLAEPHPRLGVGDRVRQPGDVVGRAPSGGGRRCAAPTSVRCRAGDRARRSAPGPAAV